MIKGVTLRVDRAVAFLNVKDGGGRLRNSEGYGLALVTVIVCSAVNGCLNVVGAGIRGNCGGVAYSVGGVEILNSTEGRILGSRGKSRALAVGPRVDSKVLVESDTCLGNVVGKSTNAAVKSVVPLVV